MILRLHGVITHSILEDFDSAATCQLISALLKMSVAYGKIGTAVFATISTVFGSVIYAKRRKVVEQHKKSSDMKLLPHKGYYLLDEVVNYMPKVENFTARPDDVYVVTFPKSGTTWCQEITYLILNDMDYEKAKVSMEDRFPYLEYYYPGLENISSMPSPRTIKSHLPYTLLPADIRKKKCKIIYCTRNPKDTQVSLYYFEKMLTVLNYRGTVGEHLELFLNDKVIYGPHWKHTLEFWNIRNQENILFLKYEDLQKTPHSCVRQIAAFLGKTLTDEQVDSVVDHCSFAKMKANPATNYKWLDDVGLRNTTEAEFIRKGIVGDWKHHYSKQMNIAMEEWHKKHFHGTGLEYEFE